MEIKNRKEENVIQGTDEWLAMRELADITASEAPAVFNKSKHLSRTGLIEEKKGIKREFGAFLLKLFKEGHETEAYAREILEEEELESYPPKVYTCEVDGLKLLASLDGRRDSNGKDLWEHKLANKELIHNVKIAQITGEFDEAYTLQMDLQLLVTGAARTKFTASDRFTGISESFYYYADQKKFEKLIAGIKQFQIDKENHVFELKKEKIVVDSEAFPVFKYDVQGSLINTNFDYYKKVLKEISDNTFELLKKKDKTDLDFGIIEKAEKDAKKARESLKAALKEVESKFEALSGFRKNAEESDAILQKLYSACGKTAKKEKDELKEKIVKDAIEEFDNYVDELIKPFYVETLVLHSLRHVHTINCDSIYNAGKGKKTIKSYKEFVSAALANEKIRNKEYLDLIKDFDNYLLSNKEYSFLFNDTMNLVNNYFGKSYLYFKEEIDLRINDHKKREEEKIRVAEQAAIKKEREENERKQKEIEAERYRKQEREEQKIKDENEARKYELEETGRKVHQTEDLITDKEKIKRLENEREAEQEKRIREEEENKRVLESFGVECVNRVPEIEVTTPMPEVKPPKGKDVFLGYSVRKFVDIITEEMEGYEAICECGEDEEALGIIRESMKCLREVYNGS